MKKIDLKDLPTLLLFYAGLVSPYFIALYIYDKQEFLSLPFLYNVLLCIGYSLPIFYLIFLNITFISYYLPDFDELVREYSLKLFLYVCACSSAYLYSILFIFIGLVKNPNFICYRNTTWFVVFISTIISLLLLILNLILNKKRNPQKSNDQNNKNQP